MNMTFSNYSWKLRREIYDFLKKEDIGVSQLAVKLSISTGTLYSKICGRRGWKVEELERLAELGIQVPSFNQPRGGEGRA